MAKRLNVGVDAFERLMKSRKNFKPDDNDDLEVGKLFNQEEEQEEKGKKSVKKKVEQLI